jgi:hypothetical protein
MGRLLRCHRSTRLLGCLANVDPVILGPPREVCLFFLVKPGEALEALKWFAEAAVYYQDDC